MSSEFEEKPKGVVVSMDDENSFSGYSYTVWFPYTRDFVRKVKEGSFIAIKNFLSNSTEQKFSILEIVSAVPQHYALGSSSSDAEKAFPAFFIEAAKSCRQDWEQDEPIEQTTVIKAQTIPTGLQVTFNGTKFNNPEPDESMPMIGEEAHLLSESFTNLVVNQGLISSDVPIITPGNLVLNPNIKVSISVEDLLRTHFGVFGFTGAGKSNLMSTMLSSLMNQDKNKLKIFLFDLMSEYTGILIDLIDQTDNSYIVVFGVDSLPGGESTVQYLSGKKDKENEAVESIKRTILLPKELASYRDQYTDKIRRLLQNHKIRVYDEGETLTYSRVRDAIQQNISGNLGAAKGPVESWVEAKLSGEGYAVLTPEEITLLITELQGFLRDKRIPASFLSEEAVSQNKGTLGSFSAQSSIPATRRTSQRMIELKDTAISVLSSMVSTLSRFASRTQEKMPPEMTISFDEIIRISNSKEKSSIIIFQCNRDDELRERSSLIMNGLFELRRRLGIMDPVTLSVYDEADEFMPGQVKADSSYAFSLGCIRNIARRGRKFGMGLGIATQRVAYLDTSTLAQPHTYFISKMPRKYDRDTMADAFGVTEDMMKKTLRFTKGQWLLVSFDATGLINVPIPIHLPNANDRIKRYLSP